MIEANERNLTYIGISKFLEFFGSIHNTYTGYIQHDAQEFFRFLLDDISKDLNKNKSKYNYEEIVYTNERDKMLTETEFLDFSYKKENSIVTELFYNEIMSKYTCCICSDIHYNFQNIFDIPLLLPEKQKEVNLEDLLKYHYNPELVEFESKCNKCQIIGKHLKEIFISKPAPILIFSLQRINTVTETKNECIVNIPNFLELNKFMDKDFMRNKTFSYNLYGVINHFGTIKFGHYNCLIRGKENKNWVCFDDKKILHLKEDFNKLYNAYILIYLLNN